MNTYNLQKFSNKSAYLQILATVPISQAGNALPAAKLQKYLVLKGGR